MAAMSEASTALGGDMADVLREPLWKWVLARPEVWEPRAREPRGREGERREEEAPEAGEGWEGWSVL